MRWRILGPVEVVWADGRVLRLRRPQERAVLAYLLLNANLVVSSDQLVEALWGGAPPSTARTRTHACVSHIRRALREAGVDDGVLTSQVGGYRLVVGVDALDLGEFTDLVDRARTARAGGEPADAADLLQEALALWHGTALTGAAGTFVESAASALQEQRLTATEELASAELELGRHSSLVEKLRPLVDANPLRERLVGLLMLALAGCGRQAEALRLYAEIRSRLTDQLGVEPGADITAAHLRVLRQQVGAATAVRGAQSPPRQRSSSPLSIAGPAVPAPKPWSIPALLPADIADFSGRESQVNDLRELFGNQADPEPPAFAPVVAAIAGMCGIGKTALAVHVAHRVAGSYPDGQLYVNLRGAQATPLDAADVLARFLRALGVDNAAVPHDVAERAELFRSHVAGRQLLIVLDNAASEEQIRPLLPGTPSCAVLITSRARLSSIEGIRSVQLDPFEPDEAIQLLGRIADSHRVATQHADATDIVRLCGYLPLAVRIAGARLTARPGWRLAELVGTLKDERRRLDQLATGDLEVRASLAWSYHAIDADSRRLFRLLGLFDTPDFPDWLAAAVLQTAIETAITGLEALVDAQLLANADTDVTGQRRYQFHDLVRLYARERAEIEDSHDDRLAAHRRGFDAWLARR